MGLAYVAAEYFIEVLGRSPNFSISCDKLIILKNQANKKISSYLEKTSKNDLFSIFKKFPDVFVCSGNTISLTDAFLSLYAFPNSANFSAGLKCGNAYENATIEYFKLLLSRCDTWNVFKLFNVLYTENPELAAYYSQYTLADMYMFFQTHSDVFIIVNDSVFLLKQSCNMKPLSLSEGTSIESMKKLTSSVYFLLSCFESLHYIELKQCISFVINSVRRFLNHYTLIKQRELFGKIPEAIMDECGYLTLKNYNVCTPKSRKMMLVLLIVCIVAFKREIHFLIVFEEVKRRASSDISNSLCSLSIAEQFKFFKDFSEFFVICDNGNVSLLPSFIFPRCTFEGPSTYPSSQTFQQVANSIDSQSALDNVKSNTIFQTQQNMLNSNVFYPEPNNIQSSINLQIATSVQTKSQNLISSLADNKEGTAIPDSVKSITDSYSSSFSEMPSASSGKLKGQEIYAIPHNIQYPDISIKSKTSSVASSTYQVSSSTLFNATENVSMLYKCSSSSVLQSCNSNSPNNEQNTKLQDANDVTESKSTENSASSVTDIAKKRVKNAILYLLKSADSPTCKNVLKTIFLVLQDVLATFHDPSTDKYIFIKECCLLYIESKHNLENGFSDVYDIEKEDELLLFITYLLVERNNRHYFKLSTILTEKKIEACLSAMCVSDILKYFKKMNGNVAFTLSETGFLNLNKTFKSINILMNSYSDLISEIEQAPNCNISNQKQVSVESLEGQTPNNCIKVESDVTVEEVKPLTAISQIGGVGTKLCNNVCNIEIQVSTDVFNRTKNSIFYLRRYFGPSNPKDVLETILHALIDVRISYCNLCSIDQRKFVEIYFQFIDESSKDILSDDLDFLTKNINVVEKNVLAVTYLLLKESKMHFQEIVNILKEYNVQCSICQNSKSDLFKYFKTLSDFFAIDNQGYICLNDSFHYISFVINLTFASFLRKPSNNIDENKTVSSKHYPLVNADTDDASLKNGNDMNSSKHISIRTGKNDNEVISAITDACFSILSYCGKMHVEELCNRLNSYKMKSIQNFLSFYTISKKLSFFKSMPQNFDVTTEGFVSLKKDAIVSNVPKNPTEIFIQSPESVASSGTSETYSLESAANSTRSNSCRGRRGRMWIRTDSKNCKLTKSNLQPILSTNSNANLEHIRNEIQRPSKSKSNAGCWKEMQNVSSFVSKLDVSLSDNSETDEYTSVASSDSSTSKKSEILCNTYLKPEKEETFEYISAINNVNFVENEVNNLQSDFNSGIDFVSTSEKVSKGDIQFQMPRQPLEVKNSKMIESVVASNDGVALDTYQKGKKFDSNLEFHSNSSPTLKNLPSDQLSSEDLKKCSVSNIDPQKLTESAELLLLNSDIPPSLSQKGVSHSKSFENDVSYGTELLDYLLGKQEFDECMPNTDSTHQVSFQNEQSMLKLHNDIVDKSVSLSKITDNGKSSACHDISSFHKSIDYNELATSKCQSARSTPSLSQRMESNSKSIQNDVPYCTDFVDSLLGELELDEYMSDSTHQVSFQNGQSVLKLQNCCVDKPKSLSKTPDAGNSNACQNKSPFRKLNDNNELETSKCQSAQSDHLLKSCIKNDVSYGTELVNSLLGELDLDECMSNTDSTY